MLEGAYFYSERFLSAIVTSTPVQISLILLQTIGILLSFGLLVGIVVLLIKTDYVGGKKKNWKLIFEPEPESSNYSLARAWKDTSARLEEGYKNYSQLILDATKLMERHLQEVGYVGETLEDQLSHTTPAEIRNIADILAAWRKAKMLLEEKDPEASFQEAEMVISAYEKALIELGMLSS